LLQMCFADEVVQKILAIPISHSRCNDKMFWWRQTSGECSVKTGYHVAKEILHGNMGEHEVIQSTVAANFWKWLWGMKFPHKIRLLGWKCCRGILPTKFNFGQKSTQYCS
ncbi:hypothetical protein CFOL_v3_16666, partial [Cephalotus follicularis]